MNAAIELKATRRTSRGKGLARKARVTGQVPAVVYGPETESAALTVEARDVAKILRRSAGVNTLVHLVVDGEASRRVLIRDYQIHPVKRTLLHVDFYDVGADRTVLVKVPIRFEGRSELEKAGARRQVVLRELRVRCTPDAIPEALVLDLTGTSMSRVRISEMPVPEGVEVIYRVDQPVLMLKAQTDEPEEGEGGEEAEGDEGAEGSETAE